MSPGVAWPIVTRAMANADSPSTGAVIGGRFELGRLLGEGASGVVYEARDLVVRRRVAVKLLHSDLLGSEEHLSRFFREMRAAQRIRHPGIVAFIASGTAEDERPYLVQEFLYGQDMEQALESGSLDLPAIFEIALQLLDALSAVHAAGLVHRDVKPANLFLFHDEFGGLRAKLVDFGIVTLGSTAMELTATGRTVGTPHYMSPEQARAGDLDARADLWSVGVLLFEALAGGLPFDDESPYEVLLQIVGTDAPSLATRRGDLPAGLIEVIDRALRRDVQERWRSATEMAAALRRGVGLA